MSENSIGDMKTMSPAPDGGSSLGRVDRYSLEERIGQGGFGSVWKAVDIETGVHVAIKALHPLIAANRDELERVRQNFVLVSRLTHPGICVLRYLHKIERIDDQAQSNLRIGQGDYLVVMDLVDGVTLTQYQLARGGTLPLDEAIDLGAKIADALDYAHSQRIVHRDIKPSNIMITQNLDGTRAVKILDFGLAAEIRNSLSRVSRDLGDTTGTRPYMAPEQWFGKRQNAKSDQYSLAVLLYELIEGEVPFASAFESGDPLVMMNVVKGQFPEPLDECSAAQNNGLARALAKEKDARFPTCMSFIDAFLVSEVTQEPESGTKAPASNDSIAAAPHLETQRKSRDAGKEEHSAVQPFSLRVILTAARAGAAGLLPALTLFIYYDILEGRSIVGAIILMLLSIVTSCLIITRLLRPHFRGGPACV